VTARPEEFIRLSLVGRDRRQPASIVSGEEEFARQLKDRSAQAWEALFERHFDPIYRYALGRLFCREAAEDVAAATFDRALSMIEGYSYRGRPMLAWLYGIARNVVSETRRSERRQAATGVLDSLLHRSNGHRASSTLAPLHVDAADALVSRLDLEHAMRRLTQVQREVVLLRYFAGLSAAETGHVIGRPETAVYALQARALAALRRQLA
jgi:RNA polymerase sigma-70 factor (ECF subfamily)